MRNAQATWSCSAQLIRMCLTLPEWRSCHERSIWGNQLEPTEEGVRRHISVAAGIVSRNVCWCERLAQSKRDGGDATDPRAGNSGILVAARSAVHRPFESI